MTNRIEGIMERQSCLNASSFKVQYTVHPTAAANREERGGLLLRLLHHGPGTTLLEVEVGLC